MLTAIATQRESRAAVPRATRVFKRYPNRKLYDTLHSRYVNHAELAELVRAGARVRVVDVATRRDVTGVALARILSLEEKRSPATRRDALLELIRAQCEAAEGAPPPQPIAELVPAPRHLKVCADPAATLLDALLGAGERGTFTARQSLGALLAGLERLEGRARARGEAVADVVASIERLKRQLGRTSRRLDALHERLCQAGEERP